MKTPISVIAGYLGAGKTTLLKKIIDNLDRKFAIIMNEFGDLAIDTQIIQGKNINIAELAGGCVCCSLAGELEEATKEIIEKYHPEIIIIETTGVAEPDAIVVDVSENPLIKLDSIITIVDADALIRFPELGRTGRIQIEMADIILLNKIDLVDESKRVELKTLIRTVNEKAPIFETAHCDVDIDFLFGLEIEHHLKNTHPDHKTTTESFTVELPKPINRETFEQFLLQLPKQVYRAKGFVSFAEDETYLLNYVAGRWELEPFKTQTLSLVFIGENLISIKQKIINTLNKLK